MGNGPTADMGDIVSIYYWIIDAKTKKEMGNNVGSPSPLKLKLGGAYTDHNLSLGIKGMHLNGRRKIKANEWHYIIDLMEIFHQQ